MLLWIILNIKRRNITYVIEAHFVSLPGFFPPRGTIILKLVIYHDHNINFLLLRFL